MIKMPRLALIAIISLGFFLPTFPASADRAITCKSYKGRYNFCRVDTRGGVRLSQQLSNASCRQGRTWGYDREGIWVDEGCSAEFLVRDRYNDGGYNNDYDHPSYQSIECGSPDGRYKRCGINLRGSRVYLKRQLSSSGCWQGDTWGYDRDAIWVDNGCRGLFEVRR